MTILRMGDDVAASALTTVGPLDVVAGYTSGIWPDYPAMVATFPHIRHLAIAVNAAEPGDALDVERGDATPADVPGWRSSWKPFGNTFKPVIYTQLGSVRNISQDTGIFLWTAHWNSVPHICTPQQCDPKGIYGLTRAADMTQWTDHGGAWDESQAQSYVFIDPPTDPPGVHMARNALPATAYPIQSVSQGWSPSANTGGGAWEYDVIMLGHDGHVYHVWFLVGHGWNGPEDLTLAG